AEKGIRRQGARRPAGRFVARRVDPGGRRQDDQALGRTDRQTGARAFRAPEDHPFHHFLSRRTAPGQRRQLRDDESLGGRDRTAPGYAVYLSGEPQGQGRGRLARVSPRGVLRRLSWCRALPRVAGRRGPPDTRFRGRATAPPGSPRVGPETTSSETRV